MMPRQVMRVIEPPIEIATWWKHTSGRMYCVLLITNEADYGNEPGGNGRYPVTVVSYGENGKYWSRRRDDWHRSMTFVKDYKPVFRFDPEVERFAGTPEFRAVHQQLGMLIAVLRKSGMFNGTVNLPGAVLRIL